ncbi:MAG: hypothetical protein DMG21_14900 [Acidobacteria bacterium]|nr:MAG: hypothetical protein DMG21_14900 [Acidobacteriota bacterium]
MVVALAMSSPALVAAPRGTWWVVRSANFDARVSHELEELARREGATVRYIETAKSPRALTLVFEQAESPEAFIKDLKQGADSPTLTEATEREGYILDATYLGERPKLIHISAISAAGFHHALRQASR